METWSRQRKEQKDALNRRRAQLDAYAGKLQLQESRLVSREAEIELAMKELQTQDERLTVESNELDLECERLEKREEPAAGLENLYHQNVETFNAKLAERHEEHRLKMLADLKAGRESYREELRAEFGDKCKVQEDRFKERRRELEAEKRSLERNQDRVRRERNRSEERRVGKECRL